MGDRRVRPAGDRGVAHERDRTVACEVAHTRVATPTAAGELLAARWQGADEELTALADRLGAASRLLADRGRALASLASRTRQTVHGSVTAHRRELDRNSPRPRVVVLAQLPVAVRPPSLARLHQNDVGATCTKLQGKEKRTNILTSTIPRISKDGRGST